MNSSHKELYEILFHSDWERKPMANKPFEGFSAFVPSPTTLTVKMQGHVYQLTLIEAEIIYKMWDHIHANYRHLPEDGLIKNYEAAVKRKLPDRLYNTIALNVYRDMCGAPYNNYRTLAHRCAIAHTNYTKSLLKNSDLQHLPYGTDYYGEKIMTHRTKEEIKMQNAAALIMEGVTTVNCIYQADNDRHLTYKFLVGTELAGTIRNLLDSLEAKNLNDVDFLDAAPRALAPKNDGGFTIVKIVSIDDEPEIELEGEIYYKFLDEIVPAETSGERAQAVRDKIAETIKGRRRVSTRNQLLAQYGIEADEIKKIAGGE